MNLIVWQRAMDLFQRAWQITHTDVPIDFKLRSQLVDAAQSVSANIAEGYGRRDINEYLQFLYVGLGSLGEILTRAIGLKQTKQISDAQFRDLDLIQYEVENRLLRLIEKLESKRDDSDWINRIAEDPEEYVNTPTLQHSNTPTLRAHA
jgi:four helix bundle protein